MAIKCRTLVRLQPITHGPKKAGVVIGWRFLIVRHMYTPRESSLKILYKFKQHLLDCHFITHDLPFQYNFVGRILGPRGMTAKQLEQETGCKIMVRGRGSMRDKKKVGNRLIAGVGR